MPQPNNQSLKKVKLKKCLKKSKQLLIKSPKLLLSLKLLSQKLLSRSQSQRRKSLPVRESLWLWTSLIRLRTKMDLDDLMVLQT